MELILNNEIFNLEISGDRKSLHEIVENVDVDMDESVLEEIEELHELISNKDANGLIEGFFPETDLTFVKKEGESLVEALEGAGYQFEESMGSRSIYVKNDNGQEVRISDHKRPPVIVGASAFEHEYSLEIIVKGNEVTEGQLTEVGISLKGNYLLG